MTRIETDGRPGAQAGLGSLPGGKTADPARGLVRLLGFVLGGGVTVDEEEGVSGTGEVTLVRGPLRRKVPESLVTHCLRRGLVAREGRCLVALSPARPLLKRLLAGDAGLAHLAQHALVEQVEREVGDARRIVTVNRQESVLGTLSLLKDREGVPWFAEDALRAGERLARDFTLAGLEPRVTASLEPRLSAKTPGPGAQAELSDHRIDARNRVDAACRLLGPELSGVALDVCCFRKGLEQVERERHWPARSAKLMLRTALSLLARHYGY